jgi:glycosyltransferase involved in cell wall biosynthesis
MGQLSFLFLSANTPWVYALAEALAKNHATHTTYFYDWLNYRRLRPTWPNITPPALLQRSMHVLPPGYAGQFEWLFRPYLQGQIQCWCQKLQETTGEHPWVVAPYPYLAPWVRNIPSERLIYYNLDDYVLYKPSRKDKILKLEGELVERATLILCLSQFQVDALQKRYPYKADRIRHYPLGIVESYLNPQPERSPEPMTVGYIGNLIERVDWRLVYQVAQACPDITFVFVGGLDGIAGENKRQDWQANRAAVLALPNVRHVGKVPQAQVTQYYWSFALNWIPYDVTHPFNQASCPTKVMDGIASGRPVLSTDIPECRLYPEWIGICNSVEDAIAQLYKQLALEETPDVREKRLKQLEFAQQQIWSIRAQTLEHWLSQL